MIVQSAPPGERRHAVIAQLEHTRFAGELARHWGNGVFAPLAPRELMLHLVAHHDDGWDIVDAAIGQDPDTGLPYNLVRTPIPAIVKSGSRGPDLNEAHHPYCGLLSSMHTYGLYHGRYGLSDKVFVNVIPPEHRPAVDDVSAREQGRQERLRARLAADPEAAPWVEELALFHNYKLLQLFDTLALYFNCTHEAARGVSTFANVPRRLGDDITLTVSRIEAGVYRVEPFPFAEEETVVECRHRWLEPQPPGTSMPEALASAPEGIERMRLVS